MSFLLLVLGIILFVSLVVVHEFGHFIAARRGGIEVEEFGIGFPPRAKTLAKRSGTVFTLNWLPLGGFVKLKGEHDDNREPGSFGIASLSTKIKVMVGGVLMNLLTAFVLLTLLALVGMPKLIENQFSIKDDTKITTQDVLIGQILADSPAHKAGLKPTDQLISIGSSQVTSAENLRSITELYAGKPTIITYKRGGQQLQTTINLRSLEEANGNKGYLGIVPTEYIVQRSTWSAPIVAAGTMGQVTAVTSKGIASSVSALFKGDTSKASEQVAGPVGIAILLKNGSLLGYQFILMIIAIISLSLAIMNALPIPALDGGRLAIILLFRALRKPLKRSTEQLINFTGFAALMILFVLITIVDVKRNF